MGRDTFENAARRVGAAIRARRLQLGLVQEAVAFEAGLSTRHYQLLETGLANPTLRTLHGISCVLDIAVEQLLGVGGATDVPKTRGATRRRKTR